jgi:subtilisin family serine protease
VLDSTTVGDTDGHGTLVAGVIAAAANNKTGVVGVAPKAKIMSLRAFPKFDTEAGANQTDVAEAIDWAVEHGANVINLSLGALVGGPEQVLAVTRAVASGVLVVAAAGNESTPLCGFPAAHPLAICVGATDKLDRPASFTNYGLRLDVVAPGSSIWSTGYSAKGGPTDQFRKYQAVPGTSFASPFVAGVGALLMSMGASNLQAALILRTSAKDLGLPGYDLTYGFGRLDAKAAVEMCAQIC